MVASSMHSEPRALRSGSSTFRGELESTVRVLQRLVHAASPGSVSGDEARVLVGLFADAERAASSGIALCSPVVVETGSFAKAGHGSAADWLGAVSGSSAGAAKERLAAAERAVCVPSLTEALREGDLSTAQLKLMSQTASAAPGSEDTLLELAGAGASHQELSDAASRLRAAARCRETERARRDRVHSGRHFRWRQSPEGGIRSEMWCDEIAWARVAPWLEAEAKGRWKAAGKGEPLEAHRLDALLDLLARGGPDGGSGPVARPHTLVIVDAQALKRGTAEGDELCEIEGIGPVSVDAVIDLVGEGGMQLLVKDGVDVRTVTSTRRDLPQRVEAALIVRDRTCVVTGCGKRHGLEGDHYREDYRDEGPTSTENLARLCPEHHALKTYGGWRLEGGPDHWDWIAPAHPKSAQYIARARQLAAAKAKATRNNPRRT
jgi:hypothetical protein